MSRVGVQLKAQMVGWQRMEESLPESLVVPAPTASLPVRVFQSAKNGHYGKGCGGSDDIETSLMSVLRNSGQPSASNYQARKKGGVVRKETNCGSSA